jgi:hypothetical protein
VLVGFVPQIPDSDELDAAAIARIIAAADYDAPPAPRKSSGPVAPTRAPGDRTVAAEPSRSERGWRDRLRRR